MGGGFGALKAEPLNREAQAASRGEYERGSNPLPIEGVWRLSPRIFLKIYVSENAFQAILKPIFPYSITSNLSKVRHSDTLFPTITVVLHFIS